MSPNFNPCFTMAAWSASVASMSRSPCRYLCILVCFSLCFLSTLFGLWLVKKRHSRGFTYFESKWTRENVPPLSHKNQWHPCGFTDLVNLQKQLFFVKFPFTAMIFVTLHNIFDVSYNLILAQPLENVITKYLPREDLDLTYVPDPGPKKFWKISHFFVILGTL